MAQRSSRYMFHIVEEVERRGMPTELALLPFVESAFQPEAVSSAKAAGLWQFIPSTGKDYALEQTMWQDERRSVIDSTRAALDYLRSYTTVRRLATRAGGLQLGRRLGVARHREEPTCRPQYRLYEPEDAARDAASTCRSCRRSRTSSRAGAVRHRVAADLAISPTSSRSRGRRDIDVEHGRAAWPK